eukprot:Partr_v1_DN26918_c4_g1_i3_m7317 putative sphingosine kinase
MPAHSTSSNAPPSRPMECASPSPTACRPSGPLPRESADMASDLILATDNKSPMDNVSFYTRKTRHQGQLIFDGRRLLFSSQSRLVEVAVELDHVFAVHVVPCSSSTSPQPSRGLSRAWSSLTGLVSPVSRRHSASDDPVPSLNVLHVNSSLAGSTVKPSLVADLSRVLMAAGDRSSSCSFCVIGLDVKSRPILHQPAIRMWTFVVEPASDFAGDCSALARNYVDTISARVHSSRPGRLLVLLNPFGGRNKARDIYASLVKPIFDLAGVVAVVRETERVGHAIEIGATFDHSQYDGVVSVSGDGLFHELVNGIYSRADWHAVSRLPLGIIPAGSGNALAKSIDCQLPLTATVNVVKGQQRPFDLFAYRFAGSDKVEFGFVEVMWAFIADVDIESESMRWAGPARFILMSIVRLIKLRQYRGKLRYLLSSVLADSDVDVSLSIPGYHGPPVKYLNNMNGDGWISVEGDFTYFMAMNAPWCAHDTLPAPFCRLSDGALNLVWIENGTVKQMLRFLLDTESGTYVKEDFVRSEHVRAFVLEPTRYSVSFEGIIDVDGEQKPHLPIVVECIPSIAKLFTPHGLDERVWSGGL